MDGWAGNNGWEEFEKLTRCFATHSFSTCFPSANAAERVRQEIPATAMRTITQSERERERERDQGRGRKSFLNKTSPFLINPSVRDRRQIRLMKKKKEKKKILFIDSFNPDTIEPLVALIRINIQR